MIIYQAIVSRIGGTTWGDCTKKVYDTSPDGDRRVLELHGANATQNPTDAADTDPQAEMTEQQMLERIKLLAAEMDENDEENSAMQSEIDALCAKIDAANKLSK